MRNTLDESKDHLVLQRVYSLAVKELNAFQNDRREKPSPKLLKELMKMITLLESVKRKYDKITEDKGKELFDFKGHEIGVASNDYR